jgi:RNA polymerase sigma-70 factor (ECF subfamily)
MELELRREAVDRAYREHHDDVYRVAYAILRDAEAAVDATHETFARAFERWERYDDRRPLRAWLHGIATHEALDTLRRRRVRQIATPVLASLQAARDGGDPQAVASQRALVSDALAALQPAVRAALVLRHYYGYDYAEIAAQLGTSPGNVGSMLSRAHATLRERLVSASGAATPHPDDAPRQAAR